MRGIGAIALLGTLTINALASDATPPSQTFLKANCFDCHDPENSKGGLDLSSAKWNPADSKNFALWVKVHDRVQEGEMPPKKRTTRPDAAEQKNFLAAIAEPLIAADRSREEKEGRATWRRLNRFEYENTLRDLLHAPWLQVKEILPEDGEAFRFNKIGDALDVSHVQMAQYLQAADYALHQVLAAKTTEPEHKPTRYYARDQKVFANKMKFTEFNRSPERATFPVLGTEGQPDVRSGKLPLTAGAAKPEIREKEAMGVVASSYEPIELRFEQFEAPQAGRYKIRISGYSVWCGPGPEKKWWTPDLDKISTGHRPEPITVYSETKPRQLRWLGAFDVGIEPTVKEMEVWLLKGESIRVDASRLFRSRPPNWHNPLAEKDGTPGVAFRWLEVDGPLIDAWPTLGHKLLFGDLHAKPASESSDHIEIESTNPKADSERLLHAFIQRAYRHPVDDSDVKRFMAVIDGALKSGSTFTDAMIAGYSAVLCSPTFVCLQEKPGSLDDYALAARLSYFLWNSEPDETLRSLAAKSELHRPDVLRAQAERMISDPKSLRFTNAFLDYWVDLRKINATSPDAGIYPDYYLDDLLSESAVEETRGFFAEVLRENLPAKTIVSSDFVMINERLAEHYGIKGVSGVNIRRVKVPPDSPRGGLMTQASVLKVTANGTTTSPVLRGAWIMDRILGKPPPPPPPSVPAVEPDTRGATTIREQLDKHRTQETCAACHAKIDPAGFALESFDVMGGWRERYRSLGEGKHEIGFGKNGQPFAFHLGPPVDPSGALPDGRKFQNVSDLKKLLLADERQIARNLAQKLIIYATGAPIHFGDRPGIEQILERAAPSQYGVGSLVNEIVQSELFQRK